MQELNNEGHVALCLYVRISHFQKNENIFNLSTMISQILRFQVLYPKSVLHTTDNCLYTVREHWVYTKLQELNKTE